MQSKSVLSVAQKRAVQAMIDNDLFVKNIAGKLCIAEITLNQHLLAARKKMNCRTTHGLIIKCVQQKLVRIPELKKRRNLNPNYLGY